jgi:hypothetical protein
MRFVVSFVLVGCSGQLDSPAPPTPASPEASAPSTTVDIAPVVSGIPDDGRDPTVVAIEGPDGGTCSGVVVASNVVLTAHSCVTVPLVGWSCPASGAQVISAIDPASLTILSGDTILSGTVLAQGLELVVPDTGVYCDHDIAAIVTDGDLGISPVKPTTAAPTLTTSMRTVAFDATGAKHLREYLPVLALSAAEMEVGEATCEGDFGGAAFVEPDGALAGVVSRSGAGCTGVGAHNIYTRVDAFADLVSAALAEGVAQGGSRIKAASKPETQMGGACMSATDCSTGACVESPSNSYCSRTCGTGDRCPAGYTCTAAMGDKFCFEK